MVTRNLSRSLFIRAQKGFRAQSFHNHILPLTKESYSLTTAWGSGGGWERLTVNFLFLRHKHFINLLRMILFSYFLIFYYHDHTIIQILYKNFLTSKGNKQGFRPPIPSKQCCGAVQAASKENIKEANLKWGGGGSFIFWKMSGPFDSVF